MQLAEVLDYTNVARVRLFSGGSVTVVEKDPYLDLILKRGPMGEEEWHVAHTRADVPRVIALQGIYTRPDEWEYVVPDLATSTAYHRDCAEIRVAIADRRLPAFFDRLLRDTTHDGVVRVKGCAAIVRSGATAACMPAAVRT